MDSYLWSAPSIGGVTGLSHFLTLDGLEYSITGLGEFVFLKISEVNFEIQVSYKE
jgi:hypothetical protein